MYRPKQSPLGRATDAVEETLIAAILGAMTLITFANVVARFGFNSNILWALEATTFLFAWMVLLGASYCVKIKAHLGVDAVVNLFKPNVRRIFGLVSGGLRDLRAAVAQRRLGLLGAVRRIADHLGPRHPHRVRACARPRLVRGQ